MVDEVKISRALAEGVSYLTGPESTLTLENFGYLDIKSYNAI